MRDVGGMTSGGRILVIEEDAALARSLKVILEGRGFTALAATDGAQGLAAARGERRLDAVLASATVGGEPGGIELCRRLKAEAATSKVPLIVLAAPDAAEAQVLAGFQAGADDYLVKPVRANELFSRIQVALWRSRGGPADTKRYITVGPLELDLLGHQVRVQGSRVELTLTEFGILRLLVTRAGQTLPRDEILAAIDEGEKLVAKNVDVHLSHIRRKLGLAAGLIETVRGVGYRFRDRPITHH
jgi:two-component system phosphate regulon response regulator PhoB